MSVFPNKFASTCSNKLCSKSLGANEGFVQKVDDKYVAWCRDCVPVRISVGRKYINDSFEVFFPYDPNAVALVKSLPKAKWNPEKKCWRVSDDLSDRRRVLEVCESLQLEIPDSIKIAETEFLDPDSTASIESSTMYPFQREGSLFCLSKDKCLLGDEMGLGKSVQSLMAIPKDTSTMVICRAGIKFNWLEEVSKWRPDLNPIVVSGKDGFIWPEGNDIVIVNHDILPSFFTTPSKLPGENTHRYAERLKTFRRELASANKQASSVCLIVDEAHDFKNYSSQRSKKLKEICRLVKKVIGLTGSPLSNRPPELYGVFDVLGLAGDTFGSFDNFKKLFNARDQIVNRNGQKKTVWGNPSPIVPELLKRKMLRRLRKDVLPDLPQKTYSTVLIDLEDGSLKKQMDGLLEDWGRIISKGELPPFSSFSKIRRELATSRIPQMLELIEDAEDQGVPLVVFSSHLSPLDALLVRPGWSVISGDTPPETRQEIVNAFQKGKLKGVGVSIRAGGVGITLTNAWKAVFVDLDWSPASNWQAEDRIARIGQKSKKVEIVRLVSNHPLDIHVNRLLSQKIKVIQESIDGGINVRPSSANSESEGQFKLRMDSLIAKQEEERINTIKSRVLSIRDKALEKEGSVDLSVCKDDPESVVKAFKHMLSVCDGAVARDGFGFNKPDSFTAHWVLSSGLTEAFELEAAFLLLLGYKKQLSKNFPKLFKKNRVSV